MAKEIVVINTAEKTDSRSETTTWWKIDKYFINQDNIRALSRKGMGKGTTIRMYHGDDVHVNLEYDKLLKLFPLENKN